MKKLLYLWLGVLIFSCQKDNDITPKEASLLEGKWDRIAYESSAKGDKVWVSIAPDSIPDLIVRSDGVLLAPDGKGLCNRPDRLTVNGKLWRVNPESPVPPNQNCYLAYGISCEIIEFQVTNDNMVSFGCSGKDATRYRRLP